MSRQLAHPSGWFGYVVLARLLDRWNGALAEATLDALPLDGETRLLDVGFGSGVLLRRARARGVRRLAGIDPSEAMVDRLRRSRRWLDGAELRLERGRAEAMRFESAGFDAVTSMNTVYFWPDPSPAFAELRRVLRPGGHLALAFSSPAKLRSDPLTQHGFALHEPADLAATARAAGFGDVRVVALHGGVLEGELLLVGR